MDLEGDLFPTVWKTIQGYTAYRVSDSGDAQSCWSAARPAVKTSAWRSLKPQTRSTKRGRPTYLCVSMTPDDKSGCRSFNIHQLVAKAFIGPAPYGLPECRHVDGNYKNNHASNLAYGTSLENNLNRIRHGTIPRGETSRVSLLTERSVRSIRRLKSAHVPSADLARAFGVCKSTIDKVVSGVAWSHIAQENETWQALANLIR